MQEVAREVELAGGRALAVPTDVADWPQVEHLARAAVEPLRPHRHLGQRCRRRHRRDRRATEIAEIERIFRVNVLGVIHGVKAALPYMSEQGGGTIINIGSVAGVRAFPIQSVYSATKHAVKGLTEGLRLELWKKGGDFHITYIAPTAINTPLFPQSRTKFGTQLGPRRRSTTRGSSPSRSSSPPSIPGATSSWAAAAKMFDIMERISPAFTDWSSRERQDLPRPDHRPAARGAGQPLRAAPGPADDPRRLRRPGPSHELVYQDLRVASDPQARRGGRPGARRRGTAEGAERLAPRPGPPGGRRDRGDIGLGVLTRADGRVGSPRASGRLPPSHPSCMSRRTAWNTGSDRPARWTAAPSPATAGASAGSHGARDGSPPGLIKSTLPPWSDENARTAAHAIASGSLVGHAGGFVAVRYAEPGEPASQNHLAGEGRRAGALLVAYEPLDDGPGWRRVEPSTLVIADRNGLRTEPLDL